MRRDRFLVSRPLPGGDGRFFGPGAPPHPSPHALTQRFARQLDVAYQLGASRTPLERDLTRVEGLELGTMADAQERYFGAVNEQLHEPILALRIERRRGLIKHDD